jgi:hypothetical protein
MRPLRSSAALRVRLSVPMSVRSRMLSVGRAAFAVALAAALCVAPMALRAQGLSPEAALFLLVPVGARAVGMGQADVASDIGGESMWANPAGLARLTQKEVSINHSQTIIATGDALNAVFPAGKAGVIAASAYLVNYGQQDATDNSGSQIVTGTIYIRSYVFAASYAATFGSRISAGVTFKFVQERVDCSGTCNIAAFSASTNGLDVGVQAVVDQARRLTLGLDIRDAGLNVQVNDAPQSDPLPTRIHLGASYLVPGIEKSIPDGELRVSAEVVENASFGSAALRAGGELAYKKFFFLRLGVSGDSGDGTTASIGLGVKRGGISIDFARGFGGFSSDAGKPPTYLTLRFQF